MFESQWIAVIAWSWFALLAVAGQLWPRAGRDNFRKPDSPWPRMVTNIGLTLGDLAVGLLIPAAAIIAAWVGDTQSIGLMNWLALPGWVAVALAFILSDLLVYAIHRLAHGWPLYWRLHRIHHADTELDVLTTYRQHPLAVLVAAWLQACGVLVLGLDPIGVAIYQLVFAFHNPLHHANLAWPASGWMAKAASWLIVTPGQHSVHHSARRDETDSNFGQVFSIWDRLAGTLNFRDDDELAAIEIGLGERYAGGASSLAKQLLLPLSPDDGPELEDQTATRPAARP